MSGIWGTVLRRRLLLSRLRIASLFALTAGGTVAAIEGLHLLDRLHHARQDALQRLHEGTLALLVTLEEREHHLAREDTLALLEELRSSPLPEGVTWTVLDRGGRVWPGMPPPPRPGKDTLVLRTRWTEWGEGGFDLVVAYPIHETVRNILHRSWIEFALFIPLGALLGFGVGWLFGGWSLNILRRSLALYDQVLVQGAHDIQTPLTLIRLEASQLPEGPARRRILSALQRLEQLVENIQFLARGSEPPQDLKIVELLPRLREILDLLGAEIQARKLNVVLDARGNPQVKVNPKMLDRFLLNLLDNAVRHTRAGGKVRIRVEPACLEIRNAPIVGSGGNERLGLGSRIIREIAHAHGWNLRQHVKGEAYTVTVRFSASAH